MEEIWKDIPEYEGLYQVSNLGRIKSLQNYRGKGNILKQRIKKGYYTIGLRKNAKRKWYLTHRLVAQAFIPNPNNLPQINHIDENKLNNNVDNLEWCTVKYNNTYGTRIERVMKSNKLKKEVVQCDLNGNIIGVFESIASASRKTKTDITGISNCINKKSKTANKYIWLNKSEVLPNVQFEKNYILSE